MENYYEILQVSRNAEPEAIKGAYRGLAFKYHPDRNGTAGCDKKMKLLVEAYEVLSDPERRRAHDEELAAQGPPDSRDIALRMVELGDTLLDQEQYEKAIGQFTQAVQLNPALARAFNNRGIAYVRLGHFEEAAADFEEAYSLEPGDTSFLRNYERATAALGENNGRERHEPADHEGSLPSSNAGGAAPFYDPNRPTCPKCQAPMAIQMGRGGPFFSCLCSQAAPAKETGYRDYVPPSEFDGSTPRPLEPTLLVLLWGIPGMTVVGFLTAHFVENGILGLTGLPGGAFMGGGFGVAFGSALAIGMTRTEKAAARSYLWSALLLGMILGAIGGALIGVLAACAGSTLLGAWGAIAGLFLSLLFAAAQLSITSAFWDNARLNRDVVIGALGTGLIAALIALAIQHGSFGIEGLSEGVGLGLGAGAIFGALIGLRFARRAGSAWCTALLGSVCGAVAGSASAVVSVLTASALVAAVPGILIGAFLFATGASVACALQASKG
jgi:curved DNA-binding protein CbpA